MTPTGNAPDEAAHLPVAVALEGYGWHPEAWRHTPARESVLRAEHWIGLAAAAERGGVDFVTFDDGLTPQRRRRPRIEPRWLAGRPDAILVAARVAAATEHVGLIPVVGVTHIRPEDVGSAVAALDAVSGGRAGWQPRVSATAHEAALFGRTPVDVAWIGDKVTPLLRAAGRFRTGHPKDQPLRQRLGLPAGAPNLESVIP